MTDLRKLAHDEAAEIATEFTKISFAVDPFVETKDHVRAIRDEYSIVIESAILRGMRAAREADCLLECLRCKAGMQLITGTLKSGEVVGWNHVVNVPELGEAVPIKCSAWLIRAALAELEEPKP